MEEPSAKRPRGPDSRPHKDYNYTQRRSRSRSPRRSGQDRRRERSTDRSAEADRDRNERRARKSEGARDSPQPPARGPRRDDPRDSPRDRDQDRKYARDRSPRRERDSGRDADRRRERDNDRHDRDRARGSRSSNTQTPTQPAAAGRPSRDETRPNGVHKAEEKAKVSVATKTEIKPGEEEMADDEDETAREIRLMKQMLGFSKFKSTKNTKIPGNEKNYAVRKEKTTEYRQYMNRQGGFNRPLSPG